MYDIDHILGNCVMRPVIDKYGKEKIVERMWFHTVALFCLVEMFTRCNGVKFLDLPAFGSDEEETRKRFNNDGRQIDVGVNGDISIEISGGRDKSQSVEKPVTLSLHLEANTEANAKEESDILEYIDRARENSKTPANAPNKFNTLRNHADGEEAFIADDVHETHDQHIYGKHLGNDPRPKFRTEELSAAEEKEANLKSKILALVQQTMHDTEQRVKSVNRYREMYRNRPAYRVGFILAMIKKSRDVLNELFNVAVKHRDKWRALEELKVFELIVHTNVDTTNLVRQLVEMHIENVQGGHVTETRRSQNELKTISVRK